MRIRQKNLRLWGIRTQKIITITDTNMSLNFFMSESGKEHIGHDGETFKMNRQNKKSGKSRWRCNKRPCKASVATIADEIVSISVEYGNENIPCDLNLGQLKLSKLGFFSFHFVLIR